MIQIHLQLDLENEKLGFYEQNKKKKGTLKRNILIMKYGCCRKKALSQWANVDIRQFLREYEFNGESLIEITKEYLLL